MSSLSYRRHRSPGPIIHHAIWLYLRFTLSYLDRPRDRRALSRRRRRLLYRERRSRPEGDGTADFEADGGVGLCRLGCSQQGLETVMAQIAADTLGLPLRQVRVLHGLTQLLDEGYGAFASRSTVLGGSAVFAAANALLARIRAAGARLGRAAEQVELADGCVGAPNGRSLPPPLAADGLRVTTAFGNDNRLTYTHESAAARVAVARGRAMSKCSTVLPSRMSAASLIR